MKDTQELNIELPPVDDRKPKPAYSCSRDTGEYYGETTADPDPLDLDNWLLPAQTTLIAPPAATANKTPVWDGEKWSLVADWRGECFSKVDGAIMQWKELGELPYNLTKLPYPGAYYKWVGDAWVFSSAAELAAITTSALSARDDLLRVAAIRIAPLQDTVDLEDATPDEVVMLKKWKQFRVALNRIEQQSGFPLTIEWPIAPS